MAAAKTPANTIDVNDFASRCLSLIDEVHDRRIEVIITRNGEPIARLIPCVESPSAQHGHRPPER